MDSAGKALKSSSALAAFAGAFRTTFFDVAFAGFFEATFLGFDAAFAGRFFTIPTA
jgi:hypothetical protein